MWERDAVEASPGATAVPLRRVIGPSPANRGWRKLAMSAIAGMGWVVAGAMVFGGGYLLWHLLFGDSVGGDVWLGEPPAWVEQQAAGSDDDLPGGVPWSPDMIDRTTVPGGATAPVTVPDTSVTVATTVPATAATVATTAIAQTPVVQAPAGGPTATTVRPAAPATTAKPVTTTATTTATTTVTTVANAVTSTTVAGTSTTDVTSTTVDDETSTTVDDGGDDGSGRGRGGGGSGGGGD
jgi:hypothetical protein